MQTPEQLIDLARETNEESDLVDFKREFAPEKKAAFWAETIKDIVAFANSRGEIIVFGLLNNGEPSGIDCSSAFLLDSATLSDQVRKYTSADYNGARVVSVVRQSLEYPAILVEAVRTPLVFTKVGTYEYEQGKQKTAFSLGTVYFRHSSKSEPCSRADLEQVITRELERVRSEWLGNIRRVVEAEPGATVIVTHGAMSTSKVQITSDPSAPKVRVANLSESHPYRQNEVILRVNTAIEPRATINTHDIQAIKCFEEIDETSRPDLMHRPHNNASPQYSGEFVNLIIDGYNKDAEYFQNCRTAWKEANIYKSSTFKNAP